MFATQRIEGRLPGDAVAVLSKISTGWTTLPLQHSWAELANGIGTPMSLPPDGRGVVNWDVEGHHAAAIARLAGHRVRRV